MDASLFEKLIGAGATPSMLGEMASEEGRNREEKFFEMMRMAGAMGTPDKDQTPEQHMGRMMKQAKQLSQGMTSM